MTDEQIIKALECCSSRKNCEENCPYFELKENFFECVRVSTSDAIECIRRQQAEIDRLKTEKDNLIKTYAECQVDFLKEFVVKLKEKTSVIGFNASSEDYMDGYFAAINYYDAKINNLLKEMAGESNEN